MMTFHATVRHDSLDIRKVKVDECRLIDQVRNTLNCLLKDFIRLLQSFRHRCSSVNDLKQLVIGDDDQRIHVLLKLLNTVQRILHALLCLKTERLCDDADRKASELFRHAGNDRRPAGTGTAAHAACYKDHVGTVQHLLDFLSALCRGLFTNFRLCSCAQPLCHLLADLNYSRSLAKVKGLFIRVYSHELDTADRLINHAVNGIIATSANAYNYNTRCGFNFIGCNL